MDKEIFKNMTYGMFVLSTKHEGRDVGCFINTAVQITSDPVTIAISVNKNNFTNKAIKKEKRFALGILSEQTNPEVIGKFGFFSSKGVDKFSFFKTIYSHDLPVVDENLCGYLICEIQDFISVTTHDIFIAKVLDSKKLSNFKPMTYEFYHRVIKGKTPSSAPTFNETQTKENHNQTPNQSTNTYKKYRCMICGYIYDESIEKVKFDQLPDDWTCPLCGAPKNLFEEVE